ncbi:hypothetical protein B0H17DRAFT_1142946 [Mycena rosella]|uniref:Uncharacterized protein n=1 Tax=Mycena rosella TaxID=1033263 RepID=A0AAD7CWK4_MYCRO|nr:hypothetical protein B0H17DRAFT_1142946 [Mycena rosella]
MPMKSTSHLWACRFRMQKSELWAPKKITIRKDEGLAGSVRHRQPMVTGPQWSPMDLSGEHPIFQGTTLDFSESHCIHFKVNIPADLHTIYHSFQPKVVPVRMVWLLPTGSMHIQSIRGSPEYKPPREIQAGEQHEI